MSSRSMELAIKMSNDATKAVDGFDDVSRAALDMGDAVDKASRTTEDAGNRIDRASDATDGLASTSSKATGALGALSSGFELVGLEKYASGLQAASMATDFFSGVGDAATLILEKSAIATKVQAAASKAAAIAQRALNFAFVSSPIGLIVIAVIALVAALVIAYKKSETFRKIVDGAFHAVQGAAQFAWDWIKAHWPLLLAIITGPIGLAVLAVVKNWDKIKSAASSAFQFIEDKVNGFVDAITAPIQKVIDLVQSLLDKISSIHLPHIDVNPFNRSVVGVTGRSGIASALTAPTTVIKIDGALDPVAVARQISDLLGRRNLQVRTS